MRVIDLRLWFIGLTIVVFIGASYQNARWFPTDYDGTARGFAQEMLHLEDVSARNPSPRIIFAGGSSVIYAVDAKAIERALGIRVINMAMPNRIRSDANYFDYLLPHIREGDLIIYNNAGWFVKSTQEVEAHETREARRLADRLWEIAQIDLPERQHVDWPLLLPIPDVSVFNRLSPREWVNPVSSVWERDDHGGLVRCPTRSVSFRPHDAPSSSPNLTLIAHGGEFVRDAESRGAHVIFFETPILIAATERTKWSRYRKELRLQLAQVAPVLDATEALIFSADPDRFCDTASHVDDDVRAEWSRSLSTQLRQLPAVLALDRTGTGVAPLQLGRVNKFTTPKTD
jgi:hypothetical protein